MGTNCLKGILWNMMEVIGLLRIILVDTAKGLEVRGLVASLLCSICTAQYE